MPALIKIIFSCCLLFFSCSFIGQNENIAKNWSTDLDLPKDFKNTLIDSYNPSMIQIRENVWLNTLDINPEIPKTIVFLHGDAGNLGYFKPQIEYLKNRYRLVIFERADCGQSKAKNYKFTYSNFAEDIVLLLEKLKVTEHVIIAHSRGQEIGAVYFSKNPKNLKGFIASGTKLFVKPSIENQQFAEKEIKDNNLKFKDLRLECFQQLMTYSDKIRNSLKVDKKIIEEVFKYSCGHWTQSVGILGGIDVDIDETIKKVPIPMMQIDGADYKQDVDRNQTMLKYYLKKELVLIKGARHVPHLETPEEFNKAVEIYLKEINF